MAKNTTARTDKDHREALQRMVDSGEADSASEALRQTSYADLARRGYLNGSRGVERAAEEFGKAFGWVGVGWLAVTAIYPVEYRVGAVFALVASVACFGVSRVVRARGVGGVQGEKA